jgi:hypothetical protein
MFASHSNVLGAPIFCSSRRLKNQINNRDLLGQQKTTDLFAHYADGLIPTNCLRVASFFVVIPQIFVCSFWGFIILIY